MSVLVLHRGSLSGSPYDQWLADYDGDLLLLASREQLDLFGEELPTAGYRHAEAIDGYDLSGELEARALDLARRHGVRHVVACQERDLERAAQLREILGLPGQDLASATAFRDKVLMKESVRAAGVPIAPYAEVECATDIVAFAAEQGLPVVVKPRDGGGSIDVRIIRTQAELDDFLTTMDALEADGLPNLLVESFVPGLMCHVDGFVADGRMVFRWPSQYQYALAVFEGDHGGRLDLTLDQDDPLAHRLIDFADRVLAALPAPETYTFHAEVFHTTDDRLVLCEIACRTAGAAIRETVRTMFAADPTECWVRAQVGLAPPITCGPAPLTPSRMAGQLVLLKRPGEVVRVPGEPPFDWVEHHRLLVRPGQVTPGATFAGDFMATFVVSAPGRAESERRLRLLEEWFNAGIEIREI